MTPTTVTTHARRLLFAIMIAALPHSVEAAGCQFEMQGSGRVSTIIDGRTFRLDDGSEVRLAGIELPSATSNTAPLAALIAGREVSLRGASDMPDRYGRQPAFVFTDRSDSIQQLLLAEGAALFSAAVADKSCAEALKAAEAGARKARRGLWADSEALKNAESPGDILSRVGQFTVVEGTVTSVRQAGATTYVNFGRRWTQDFAVTISRRVVALFEPSGLPLKSLERRRIRVRGWVELRGGPRIEALRVGQIELVGDD